MIVHQNKGKKLRRAGLPVPFRILQDLFIANEVGATNRVTEQVYCMLSLPAGGEKYLKGYLATRLADEPPYIHDLARLAVLYEEYDPAFSRLKNASYLLSEFVTGTRYDRGIYPTEDEMKNGLACAKQIRDFVLERMA